MVFTVNPHRLLFLFFIAVVADGVGVDVAMVNPLQLFLLFVLLSDVAFNAVVSAVIAVVNDVGVVVQRTNLVDVVADVTGS